MSLGNLLTQIRAKVTASPLLRNRPTILTGRVLWAMVSGDTTHIAAGVAFFGLFSLFPLLLGSLAILGLFLNSEEIQHRFVGFVTANLPGSAEFVQSNLSQIVRFKSALGMGSVLGLLWLGTAVFAAITPSSNS